MSRKEKIFEGVIEKKYTILLSPYFIQFCILPRVIIEPSEALYCAKFIDLILRIKKISIAKIIENVHLVNFIIKIRVF